MLRLVVLDVVDVIDVVVDVDVLDVVDVGVGCSYFPDSGCLFGWFLV